jgi:hypothetical protein
MVEDMNAIATAKSLILALLVVGTQGGPESRLAWPLSPEPMVTLSFQAPDGRYGAGHRGVDLAATPGQQVLAAGPGVVVFAGTVAGCGVVAVDRDGGLRTTYEPVAQPSPPGSGLPRPAHRHRPARSPESSLVACLHWGISRGDEYLDPLTLIESDAQIRLKPWEGEDWN